MKPRIAFHSAFVAFVLAGSAASAQDNGGPVSPEDAASAAAVSDESRVRGQPELNRAQMRERLENMTDEERAAALETMRANRGAMRERIGNLSDEQREAFRARRESGDFGRPGRRPFGPGRGRGPGPRPDDSAISEPDA